MTLAESAGTEKLLGPSLCGGGQLRRKLNGLRSGIEACAPAPGFLQLLLLLSLLTLAGCSQSDPGSQCTSSASCPSGSYCNAGTCLTACAVDSDCSPGLVCTPVGECVQQDILYCDEGETPTPAIYAKALAFGDTFLMQPLFSECGSLTLTDPEDLPGALASQPNMLNLLCNTTFNLQSAVALLGVQDIGVCRPEVISADEVLWHVIPLGFVVGTDTDTDPFDTAMLARIDGGSVQYVVGLTDGGIGGPLPGYTWASGTGSLDGTRLDAIFNATGFLNAALALDAGSSDAGQFGYSQAGAVHALRTTEIDGGIAVDVNVQNITSQITTQPNLAAHLEGNSDYIKLDLLDPGDAGLLYVQQLTPDYAGRYDDQLDGGIHTLCWTTSNLTDAGGGWLAELVYARDVDTVFGAESNCLYTSGLP